MSVSALGRLMSRGAAVVAADPRATLASAFLLGAAPAALVGYGMEEVWPAVETEYGDAGAFALFGLSLFNAFWLEVPAQAALTPAAITYHDGRPHEVGTRIARVGARLPGLLALGLLMAAGVCLGLGALVLPGFVLYAVWGVAASALVHERLGPVAALRRSASLTKGVRGRVAAVRLVSLMLVICWSVLVIVAGLALFHDPEVLTEPTDAPLPPAYWLFSALVQTPATAWWGATQGALYAELLERRHGASSDRLADIFS